MNKGQGHDQGKNQRVFCFFFNIFFKTSLLKYSFIEVIYNVVLFSGVQQSD